MIGCQEVISYKNESDQNDLTHWDYIGVPVNILLWVGGLPNPQIQ